MVFVIALVPVPTVIVTVAVLKFPVFAFASKVIVPLLVPLVGVIVNQESVVDAVQIVFEVTAIVPAVPSFERLAVEGIDKVGATTTTDTAVEVVEAPSLSVATAVIECVPVIAIQDAV